MIALVGRPNVGKSTLFNRLAGERLAVIDERPGTTRDRLVAEAEWRGMAFDIVDTGGIDPSAFRGKPPLSLDSADYVEVIRLQAEHAIREADAVLFLVDSETGITPADQEVARILRRNQTARGGQPWPPVIVVVNKCDNAQRRAQAIEFYELGMGDPLPVSAQHGIGIGELLDAAVEHLAKIPQPDIRDEEAVRIAIVGRPNVGKSSLLNRILGEERVIVSPIPGTTRDAVDTSLRYYGTAITLIDTAGIRRRGRIAPGVEKYSVLRAVKAVDRAEVVVLVLDAAEGVTAQDAHVAGLVIDKMKSVVVAVNKWDLVPKEGDPEAEWTAAVRQALSFMDYVPVLFISAKTGLRVSQVLPMVLRVQEERLRRIPTSDLNRVLREALDDHAPPSKSGKRLNLLFVAQVDTAPPVFQFQVNDPRLVHFSYVRYLDNRLRQAFGFLGTPIRLTFRKRSRTARGKAADA